MSCEVVYRAPMTTTPHQQQAAKGWMPDDSTFGARLALIRQRMQWGNVREAAIACSIPPESWRTWERDGVTPRKLVEMATLISERTGCDLGWLVAGPALAGRMEIAPTTDVSNSGSRQLDHAVDVTSITSAVNRPNRPSGQPVSPSRRRPVSVRTPGYTMAA